MSREVSRTEFEEIEQKVNAGVKLLEKTLDFYGKVKKKENIGVQEIGDLLKEIGANKDELRWVVNTVKSVKNNPLDLQFINVQSEKKSTEMAVRLLNAMGQTSPGRGYPSASKMADDLGIKKKENRVIFEEGYKDTVEKIKSSHLSAQEKTFNIWYWICMSMFSTMAFAVCVLILRRIWEWWMDVRESWAKWAMPSKSQLKKFSWWNWIYKKDKPKGPRIYLATEKPDEDD